MEGRRNTSRCRVAPRLSRAYPRVSAPPSSGPAVAPYGPVRVRTRPDGRAASSLSRRRWPRPRLALVKVNGFVCKDPMAVTADDFFKAANLDKPRNTMGSKVGSNVTLINVMQLPGLNTLGISLARIDFAPLGENPPHTHPRATEILTVLEGTLYVGFVTSNPNKLFVKTLNKGDVFVFPEGLIHFQFNPVHDKPAVALSGLSSQNPGVITIANAVFGSKPPISDDVLAKAFQVGKETIDWLQAQFWENNNY